MSELRRKVGSIIVVAVVMVGLLIASVVGSGWGAVAADEAVTPAWWVYLPCLSREEQPSPTPTFTETPTPTATATSQPGHIEVTAWVSDANPAKHSDVTVYGKITQGGVGISGVPMEATWHYRTTTSYCSGVSNNSGIASCSRNIGNATSGYYVRIDVAMTYGGRTYYASTGFTPR